MQITSDQLQVGLFQGDDMNNYKLPMDDERDPRALKYPLMQNALIPISAGVLYILLIKVAGPLWMKMRKPYDLRTVLIVYNFFLTIANVWIFLQIGKHGWFTKYSWICEPTDYSDNEDALAVVKAGWVAYVLRYVEFMDTVFFILRKKDSQVTRLHVIHHSILPTCGWYIVARGIGGYTSIGAFLNSFVHIWMYLYYGLAALGPWIHKYLWWKKYLTILQMVQFAMMFFMTFRQIIFPSCKVDEKTLVVHLGLSILFFPMFLDFYLKNYKKRTTVPQKINGETLEIKNGKNH